MKIFERPVEGIKESKDAKVNIIERPVPTISEKDIGSGKFNERPLTNIPIDNPDEVFSKMNILMKGLDILGRPGYAVKSGIKETISQEQGDKPVNVPERFRAMLKGLTGKERLSYTEDIYKPMGVSGIPLLGFATEVALDPLNVAGGAAYKAIPKAASFVGQSLNKIPGVDKIVQSAKDVAEPITSSLNKLFVDKSNLPELAEKIEKHLSNREYLKGKSFQFGLKIRDSIWDISKKHKIPLEEVQNKIINSIEQPNIAVDMPKELADVTGMIKQSLSEMLTKELEAGVPISELSKGNRGIEYFPRIAKEKVVNYLRQARIGNSKIWNPRLANALQRKTGDFTLLEFNEFVKNNGIQSLGGKSIEQFFLKDPSLAMTIRGSRSAKAITSAEFLDDVAKTFGKNEAPDYWTTLPNTITSLMPKLEGVKFDPDIASEISRVTTRYFNPNETAPFIKAFDGIQNMWKRWTLAPFPQYHIRNMVGNLWNNYLADVNPINYPKAQAIQFYRRFKDKPDSIGLKAAMKEMDSFGISPSQADEIIDNAEKLNVLGQGWYGADVESAIEKAFKSERSLIGRAMTFGKSVENNARLAHYLDKIDKGGTATDAALSVKKYLFDYSDLTDFEKQVMKRIMPFYTWSRKNIPLQLESLWRQPQKFAPISYELRERNTNDLLKLKYTRPDLYESVPIEIRRDVDRVSYIPLEGLIPGADIAKIGNPQEAALELISPYLKGPLELAFNKNLRYGNEIQKYDNETRKLLLADIPVKFKYALTTFLPQARILNSVDRMINKKKNEEQLTPSEMALEMTLVNVYNTSLEDLKENALIILNRKKKDLESGAYSATKNLRPDEKERIRQTYESLKAEVDKIKE